MTDIIASDETARDVAKKMLELDHATRDLGMKLEHIALGTATLSMTVKPTMLNGHQTCHGGYIFTLADSAFAFACNTYNKVTVAAAADISFLLPVMQGETLTATAVEKHRAGRSGVYDVTVTNEKNQTIALFRGKSRTISDKGPLDV